MKLWRVSVGGGRFIVRARSEEEAVELGRKDAEEYFPTTEEARAQPHEARLLIDEGGPAVLEADFS